MTEKTLTEQEIAFRKIVQEHELRKRGWLETLLGPEMYRLVYGIFTNPLSVIGLVITAIFILMAIFARQIAPPVGPTYDPYLIPRDGYASEPKAPGTIWTRETPPIPGWYKLITGKDQWVHILGTTSGQFDIFYGIIWGTRIALLVGVLITGLTLLIGIIIGAISAYYGRWIDDLLMRFTEIFMAFPFLLAALTLSAILVPIFGRGVWAAVIALVTFGWMSFARMIRGEILTAKERDYVMAARVLGVKDFRIVAKHILPNAIYPVIIMASMRVGDYVLSFATLSFLGVGTQIGYADWGQIISFSRDWILSLDVYWFIIVYPGVALLLFGLGWNLIGDAVRDIMDPRLRSR